MTHNFYSFQSFQYQEKRINYKQIQKMITDALLRNYVDEVFMIYDRDHNYSLDPNQIANFFNDIFLKMNNPSRYNIQQAIKAMRQIDSNFDGRATKTQLFAALKKLIASSGFSNDDYQGSNTRIENYSSYSHPNTNNPVQTGYTQNLGTNSNINAYNLSTPTFHSANNEGYTSKNYTYTTTTQRQAYNDGTSQNMYAPNQNYVSSSYNQAPLNQGSYIPGQYSAIDALKSKNQALSTGYKTIYTNPQATYTEISKILQPNTQISNSQVNPNTTVVTTSTVSEPGITKITTTSGPGYTKVTTETFSNSTTYQY